MDWKGEDGEEEAHRLGEALFILLFLLLVKEKEMAW